MLGTSLDYDQITQIGDYYSGPFPPLFHTKKQLTDWMEDPPKGIDIPHDANPVELPVFPEKQSIWKKLLNP